MPKKKRKVNKKKASKKKVAKKKRVRSQLIISTAENGIEKDDIIYVNGTGKPANGRPSKSVKLSQIRSLSNIGCTQQEMAAIVGLNRDTFTILKKNNPIVKQIIEEGRARGCCSLRRKQYTVALGGDTVMLKWLGKNRLNQSDKLTAHIENSTGDTLRKALLGQDNDDDDNEYE